VKEAGPAERFWQRIKHSKPILDQLRQWLDKCLEHPIKQGKFAEAVTYLHNQWPKLIRYIENGAWPIDNNRAENAIRPFVIGRKNWLFSASPKGAEASANLYSLIETAKANGLEPGAYLKELLEKLPLAKSVEDIEALLPWVVKLTSKELEKGK
jgi:transposase